MKQPLKLLLAGTLAFWLAASFPAYRLGGEIGLATATLAALLCLLPTAATLFFAGGGKEQPPSRQMLVLLGGTGLRMGMVLAIGLLLTPLYPAFVIAGLRGLPGRSGWLPPEEPTITAWWTWILAFYLVTLALEVGVLAAARAPNSVSDASKKRPNQRFVEASLNGHES